MLKEYLRQPRKDLLTDLAVDYAKVFLGAGISNNDGAAYPYESVYTSPERLIMQDARDQVVAAYRVKGLDIAQKLDFPEDHIALELEFMAYLCTETQSALVTQDRTSLLDCLKEQMNFLTQHLWNWVPEFCADVEKNSGTMFYTAISKVTHGFLRLELALLEDLIAETGVEVA
jgi:anaerobic sulfite reductase subunit A